MTDVNEVPNDDNNHVQIRIGKWNLEANARFFWNDGAELALTVTKENKETILAGGILENVGRFNTPVEIILNDVEVFTFDKIMIQVRKIMGLYVIEISNGIRA